MGVKAERPVIVCKEERKETVNKCSPVAFAYLLQKWKVYSCWNHFLKKSQVLKQISVQKNLPGSVFSNGSWQFTTGTIACFLEIIAATCACFSASAAS